MPPTASDEIEKFEEEADRWWDPEGPFKPLHRIQPLRLDYLLDVVDPAGRRALDVGSGGGLLAEGLAHADARVTGIEPGESAVAAARTHAREGGLEISYYHGELGDFLREEPGEFDLVTCMEVLEHVPDPGELVAQCAQVLAPGGLLFFATLSRTLRSYLLAILGAEYVLGWLPKGTHDWDRFITPGEMEAHLRAAGLRMEDLRGMVYNPLTNGFRLGNDVSVNYLGYARKTAP